MNYLGFDINTETTPKPWGYREKICWQDALQTLVKDTVDGSKYTTGHKHFKLYSDTTGELTVYCNSLKDTTFYGNIGIGCTPSDSWFTGVNSVLEFYGSSEISSISNYVNHIDIALNTLQTSAVEWKYRTSSFAAKYSQIAGGHAFYSAISGTTGDVISFYNILLVHYTGVTVNLDKISGYFSVNGQTTSNLFKINFTTGSEYIQANGKVGINCIPSPWNASVNSVMEIYGIDCNAALTQMNSDLRLSCGAVQTGTDGLISWVYKNTSNAYATLYLQYQNTHQFYGVPNEDNGTVLNWTNNRVFYLSAGLGIATLTGSAPYFDIINTTPSDADGGRASRIYGRGYTVGGGTPVLHALGYHEFSYSLTEVESQAGMWRLYLNDGDDGSNPSVNILKALLTSMNFYVDTWLSKSAPIFYIENTSPGNADGDRACVINARGMRTATLAELGKMTFSHYGTGTDFAGKWQLNLRNAGLDDVNIITASTAGGVTIYDNVGNIGLIIDADAASSSTGNARITFINDTTHSGGVMMARSGLTATLADSLTIYADGVHDINMKTNNILQQKIAGDGKIYMYTLSDLTASGNKVYMVQDTVTKEIGYSST